MSKEVNEERTPRTVADVKEMLTKHSNGEIQRTIQNCITIQIGRASCRERV